MTRATHRCADQRCPIEVVLFTQPLGPRWCVIVQGMDGLSVHLGIIFCPYCGAKLNGLQDTKEDDR